MAEPRTHLLHLSETALHWISVAGSGAKCRVLDRGVIDAPAGESLEQWLEAKAAHAESIRLADSRPMYFCFQIDLPRRAAKQLDEVIALKIRQELGLKPADVYWAARTDRSPVAKDQIRAHVVVARREALGDLEEWRARHDLARLWVGSDLEAILALGRESILPSPTLVINAGADRATYYHTRGSGEVFKGALADPEDADDLPLGSEPDGKTSRAVFGSSDQTARWHEARGLAGLREVQPDFSRNGGGAAAAAMTEGQRPGTDAVLLGLFAQVVASHPETKSLLQSASAEAAAGPRGRKLNLLWLVPLALIGAVALGVSLLSLKGKREDARLRLLAKSNSVSAGASRLRSQSAVLERIKADRAPMIPIFTAIHEAAPSGMNLKSLHISESGQVHISASIKKAGGPTEFLNALGKSDVFERVSMPEEKRSRQQKEQIDFEISAQVKGRSNARTAGRR